MGSKAAYVVPVVQKLTTETQPADFMASDTLKQAFLNGVATGLTTTALPVTASMLSITSVTGNGRRMRRGLASTELTINYTLTLERDSNGTDADGVAKKAAVLAEVNTLLSAAAYTGALNSALTGASMTLTSPSVAPATIVLAAINVVDLNPTAAPTSAPGAAPAKEDAKGIIPGLSNGVFGAIAGVGALAILGGVYAYMNPGALGGMCGSNKVEILPTSEDGVLRPVPGT
jgi:hypothetical protein